MAFAFFFFFFVPVVQMPWAAKIYLYFAQLHIFSKSCIKKKQQQQVWDTLKFSLFFCNSYSVMVVPSLVAGDLDRIFIRWYKY